MRYIHTKLCDAKLCKALITRNMKGKTVNACMIGGNAKIIECGAPSHPKTWMRMLGESKEVGIINTFDMEKFFDKESLIDIMFTLSKKGEVSNKDYRMWFKLN